MATSGSQTADQSKTGTRSHTRRVVNDLGLAIVSGRHAESRLLRGDQGPAHQNRVSRTVLRESLKTLSAKLGIAHDEFVRADQGVHLAVAEAGANPLFASISTLIEVVLVALRTISSPAEAPQRLSTSVAQRRRIASAIANGDPDEARLAVRIIIDNGIDESAPRPEHAGLTLYSRASACTGSSRAAERAGMKPKTTPIRLEESRAAAIESGE